jgi:uncharacterized membrane protein
MNDLIVIAYPSETKAEQARAKLLGMQKEYLIELGDAAIAVKQADGGITMNQMFNATMLGAASGSFWGLLIGLIFMNPLLGAAVGAASGALGGALSDFGIDDAFMKEVAQSIAPGQAALFLLVRKITTDKVLADLRPFGGTILRTSFEKPKEDALRALLAGPPPAA